jgi:hypothetical protein
VVHEHTNRSLIGKNAVRPLYRALNRRSASLSAVIMHD